MEDDIVCLGTSMPITSRTDERPVAAITLHVDKYGSTPAHTLTFSRAASTVVLVGRRSASDNPGDDYIAVSDKNASFRCAVVSRRHGKIAFSDSGHAYLIDLGSHHGTYVRSLADRVSRALVRETPTLLMDGDIITFGKAVGRGEESVQPIVARVELVYAPVSNTADESAAVRLSTPSTLHVSPVSPGRSSTGRYGIHVGTSPLSSSSSSSSDGDGDSMEHESFSDIEEIPPPIIQAKRHSQNKVECQHGQEAMLHGQSQGESSTTPAWSTPVPAIPQMINRVANSLLFPPRTSLPRDQPSTTFWFTKRFQCPTPEQNQSPAFKDSTSNNKQEQPSGEGDEDWNDSRTHEDDRERRLRDALAQRRAQRQGQGNAASVAPAVADAHVPLSADVPTTGTPSVVNNIEQPVSSGDLPLPNPSSVPVLNRLPSMTALIERPLVHLSQYILGGLGADKTKQGTHNSVDADDVITKTVDAGPSSAINAEAQATEQAPVGKTGPDNSDITEDGAMPGRSTVFPVWDGQTKQSPQYGVLPSLATALSPGHGNDHVHGHANTLAPNAWMRTWYSSQTAPSVAMFMPAPSLRPPSPLPSSNTWNMEVAQWWDTCAGLNAGQTDDQSRSTEEQQYVPISAPAPVLYYNSDVTRLPLPSMDTAERGPAQSPPPLARISPSPSPGLSYASSRESSPASSEGPEKSTTIQKEREMSEPMELSSPGSMPGRRRVEKGKCHGNFDAWFSASEDSLHEDREDEGEDDDDDDDDMDDDDGERDMDVEAESAGNDSSPGGSLLEARTGRSYFLSFMRDRAAVQEAEIRRAQEQEREREREREREWQSAVEKRETQRREKQREVEMRYLQDAVNGLRVDLNSLRVQTNAQYTSHSDQLASFDGRIREVDAECGVLCVRVESLGERLEVAQIDVASVNAALDNILSNEANESRSGNLVSEGGDDAVTGTNVVKAGEADMMALIDEMNALRASTQLQVDEELRALRTLRSEAEAAYAAFTQRMCVKAEEAQAQTQPPVLPSLKRKRDDSDEDEAAPNGDDDRSHEDLLKHTNEHVFEHGQADDVAILLPLVTSDSVSAPNAGSALPALSPAVEHLTPAVRDDHPSPRKRARKIGRFVARTATAVGVGAVVTWTALAFS